jgi:hypothetical protein
MQKQYTIMPNSTLTLTLDEILGDHKKTIIKSDTPNFIQKVDVQVTIQIGKWVYRINIVKAL